MLLPGFYPQVFPLSATFERSNFSFYSCFNLQFEEMGSPLRLRRRTAQHNIDRCSRFNSSNEDGHRSILLDEIQKYACIVDDWLTSKLPAQIWDVILIERGSVCQAGGCLIGQNAWHVQDISCIRKQRSIYHSGRAVVGQCECDGLINIGQLI